MSFPYSRCGYPDPIEVVKLYYDWRKSMFPSRVVKKICTCSFSTVYSTVQKWVDSRLFLILDSCANRESRTSYWESSQGLSLKRQKTKDSPTTDVSIIFWRHTAVTQHSMVYSCTNCLYVRNKTNSSFKVNVSSRTSVSSFISSSTVSNVCSKCKQTVYTRVQTRR